MTDEVLMRCFETGEEPPAGFHHREHVRVAWCYLRRMPLLQALDSFRTGLRRFADVHGAPQKYHETMTVAYVLLIHERLEAGDRDLGWDEFVARNPDLLAWGPSILERYYRPETLASDRARQVFVTPDNTAHFLSRRNRRPGRRVATLVEAPDVDRDRARGIVKTP